MTAGPRRPRPVIGLMAGLAGVLAVTAALVPLRSDITLATPALALVVPVVLAGWLGGTRWTAVLTALVAAAAYNLAFIPPFWTYHVALLDDGVALGVFTIVAVIVGDLVAREGEGRRVAEQRAEELQALHDRLQAAQREQERLAEEAARVAVMEQVDQQRAALLRSVSHDLRTPLATIRAVASDLRDGANYDEATRNELLDLVGGEAERLDRIVANVLSLSRIEAGALTPSRQAIALDELVEESARRLRRLLGKVRLVVDVSPTLPLADADYSQIDQVLSNLIENAVRHAPAGSTVRISARSAGPMIEVWVDDEGPGLLPFERERVFQPYRSASSGIGLTICRAIVEAHDGTIRAEESPGGGARFAFTIPAHRG